MRAAEDTFALIIDAATSMLSTYHSIFAIRKKIYMVHNKGQIYDI